MNLVWNQFDYSTLTGGLSTSGSPVIVDEIGIILVLGLLSARAASLLRIPVIVPLILTGLIIGPSGLSILSPNSFGFSIAGVAFFLVPLYLFGTGLETDLRELRKVAKSVFLLATLGVAITTIGVAGIGYYVLRLPLTISLLVGGIVSATDPIVIFPLLKSGKLAPKIAAVAGGESALNDPTSIVIFTIILSVVAGQSPPSGPIIAFDFVRLLFGGVGVGLLVGVASMALVERFRFRDQMNYASVVIFTVAYGLADALGTSGIAAAMISGMVVGAAMKERFTAFERQQVNYLWSIVAFVTQVAIFLLLGVYAPVGTFGEGNFLLGLGISASLIFLVRPAAVWASTALDDISPREKALISWVGARGAVPAALAFALIGYSVSIPSLKPYTETVFSIVLFIVLVTVLVSGFTTGFLAKRLGVQAGASAESG
jgi:cell volume regulation protein A